MPKPKETPSIKSDDSLQFILEGDTKKLFLLTIYVGTVILGFIYWAIASPNESLWSQKSNPFNKYFVKNGWFWTSILFFWCRGLEVNAFFRWLSATAYWYIITQEFFGPSIIDRFFVITGGRCSDVSLSEAYTCKKGNGCSFIPSEKQECIEPFYGGSSYSLVVDVIYDSYIFSFLPGKSNWYYSGGFVLVAVLSLYTSKV
ncbi:5176_t:CDS:2 [Acaulospora morrowiae]|uniref:5176_t:CDS:1 n=1 Tax=Acaulospora morrowiae TaxID=94023 RepID=A0A9N9HWV1_9GLOM|nr:5176_t:CDS:2 [Acaulospora morrowiae]